MNYLDIIILGILVLGIISGMRKGLIISILNIVSLIITCVLCFTLTGAISKLVLKYTQIAAGINSLVSDRLNSLDPVTTIVINKLKVNGMSTNEFLTIGFINVATFIILFLVITIIMSFLKQGVRKGIKRSILGPVDTILGGVLGFFKWILILMVMFAFVTPIIPLLSENNQFYTLIKGSLFTESFINYNFITTLINNFINTNLKGLLKL